MKPTVISSVIIMNVIMNALVITVIARYQQLREDRTTLFMFSLSVSDLAAGCTYMPISAALCSKATPRVANMLGYLPKVHAFLLWWFGFNSMYSLCWLTVSKTIAILNPLRSEQLLTRSRCYVIIALTWIIGCLLATANFKVNITWNTMICSNQLPKDLGISVFYMIYFGVGAILPGIAIVYCTARICTVVVRTHRRISALEQSVTVGTGNPGFVTAQAMRSSKNVIIICVMSLALNVPLLLHFITRNINNFVLPDMFIFTAMWVFESSTFVNSLLYLFLYRSVRRKTAQMISTVIANIRALHSGRW